MENKEAVCKKRFRVWGRRTKIMMTWTGNKNSFLIFFLNSDDVENCGSFKSFGFIYIYR